MKSTVLTTNVLAICVATSALSFPERNSEIQAALNAKVSLGGAIATAEAAAGSGIPTFANTETEHGVTNYEIRIVEPTKRHVYVVDPQSGAVTKSAESKPSLADVAQAGVIHVSKVDLAGAIRSAQASGGRAMEAELLKEHGAYVYKINIVEKDDTREVRIDAKTGDALKSDIDDEFHAH